MDRSCLKILADAAEHKADVEEDSIPSNCGLAYGTMLYIYNNGERRGSRLDSLILKKSRWFPIREYIFTTIAQLTAPSQRLDGNLVASN